MDTQRCVGGGGAKMKQLVCANKAGGTGICEDMIPGGCGVWCVV